MDSGADRDLLNLYMNATECDVDEFCEQALEVLKKHLPFDSAIVVEGYKNKGESPVAGSLHLHNQPIEKWYDYQSFRGLDPIASVAASHPGKTFAQDVSFIPKTSKFSRFCDYMKRYEVSHALLTFTASRHHNAEQPQRMRAISLWRAQAKHHFSHDQQAQAQRLLPHWMQARELNQRSVLAAQISDRPSCTLVCTMSGRILTAEPSVGLLLQVEWPGWDHPFLPPPCLVGLVSNPRLEYRGHSLVAKARSIGRNFVIQIRPHESVAGLSAAESTVARLAAQAMSYKRISAALGVSPSTVRNQLHAVYAKLALRNKGELIALFAGRTLGSPG